MYYTPDPQAAAPAQAPQAVTTAPPQDWEQIDMELEP